MKNTFRTFLLALAAVAFVVSPARAQERTIALSVGDDASVAVYCKYIGTSGKGYISVAAGGDITFEDVDSSTVTTTFECPVSGALGGIIDVSDTACDTVGEFLDIVNTSTSNWRCFAHGALRTDSTNDTFLTVSDKVATGPDGYGILFDTDVFLSQRIVATPTIAAPNYALSRYITNTGPLSSTMNRKPWELYVSKINSVSTLSTYGSGTSTLKVWSVDVTNGLTGPAETVTTMWSEAAGATTVLKTFGGCDTAATGCSPAWGTELFGLPGQKLLISLENSAAMATTTLSTSGKQYFVGQRP